MTEVALATDHASPTRAVGWVELHLGTRVEISCRADSLAAGQEAVRRAFHEVRQIHNLMSFHERDWLVGKLAKHLHQRGQVAVAVAQMEHARTAVAVKRLEDDIAELGADINEKRKVAIIGEGVEKELYERGESALNTLIKINGVNFTVIGTYKKKSNDGDGEEGQKQIFVLLPCRSSV